MSNRVQRLLLGGETQRAAKFGTQQACTFRTNSKEKTHRLSRGDKIL